MEDNRMMAIIWTAALGALIAAIFMMSSCVESQDEKVKAFADQCVRSGHKYIATDKAFGMCI